MQWRFRCTKAWFVSQRKEYFTRAGVSWRIGWKGNVLSFNYPVRPLLILYFWWTGIIEMRVSILANSYTLRFAWWSLHQNCTRQEYCSQEGWLRIVEQMKKRCSTVSCSFWSGLNLELIPIILQESSRNISRDGINLSLATN